MQDKYQPSDPHREAILCKRQLDALRDITAALSKSNFIDLLKLIAEHAQNLLEVETILIPIMDEGHQSYTYQAAVGKNTQEILGESLPVNFGICGWVWHNKRAWWSGTLEEMDEADQVRWKDTARNLILTPLIGRHSFLGGLTAIDKRDGSPFNRNDLEMLELFSSHIALAIENAKLYEQLQKNNQSLEQRVAERTIELQAIQQDLIEQEKMAALGNMVAGVAHEVNTPLGVAMTGITHISAEIKAIEKKLQEQNLTRGNFEQFIQNNQTASQLVHDNLYRAKQLIKSFKQVAVDQHNDIELREFLIAPYVNDILAGFSSQFKKQGIQVKNEITENLSINSYPGVIAQLFSNLITNALFHAFHEQSSGCIRVYNKQDMDYIHLYFEDDGVGIAADHIKRIFEPFFTTERGRGGSGLGLSICYNLVTQKLGGKINCQSQPKHGSCFTISLPIQTTP